MTQFLFLQDFDSDEILMKREKPSKAEGVEVLIKKHSPMIKLKFVIPRAIRIH